MRTKFSDYLIFNKDYITSSGMTQFYWTVLLDVPAYYSSEGLLHWNRVQCKIMKCDNLLITCLIILVCNTEI